MQIAENVRDFRDRGARRHSAASTRDRFAASSVRHSAARCLCSIPLTQPRRGRRRVTCSEACRRRRDDLTRKLRRRRVWLDMWRALAVTGGCSRRQARRELAELRTDIRLLECDLAGELGDRE